MSVEYRVISIGALSHNRLWGETAAVRTAHATTTVICERGTARCLFHQNKWCWMDQPDGPWEEESAGELARDDMFIAQAHAFLDAVDGRAAPVCSLSEGAQTLRVCLAALRSADEGGWQVPLQG